MKEKTFKQLVITIVSLIMVCFMYFILFKTTKVESLSTNNQVEQKEKEDKKLSNIYPKPFLKDEVKNRVLEALKEYVDLGHRGITVGMGPYESYSNYMYMRDIEAYENNKNVKMDENGFPMIFYEDGYFYNPVSFCHFTLSMYADYLKTENEDLKNYFLKCADFLITLQDKEGAFRYPFEWYNYNSGETYPKDWVSFMA